MLLIGVNSDVSTEKLKKDDGHMSTGHIFEIDHFSYLINNFSN